MTKHFKTDNVVVRKFNMNDVEQVYFNLLLKNNSTNTEENPSRKTNVKSKNNKKEKIGNRDIKDENAPDKKIMYKDIEETRLIVRSAMNEYYTDEPTWAVEDKVHKNVVGIIRVTNYSAKNRMCNITWLMSYKYWNNNFMKDALSQIFKFLFTKKDIDLIECSYYEKDDRASVILDDIGMVKEAVLRDRRIDEETHKKENYVIYSISKEEFFGLHGKKFKL